MHKNKLYYHFFYVYFLYDKIFYFSFFYLIYVKFYYYNFFELCIFSTDNEFNNVIKYAFNLKV